MNIGTWLDYNLPSILSTLYTGRREKQPTWNYTLKRIGAQIWCRKVTQIWFRRACLLCLALIESSQIITIIQCLSLAQSQTIFAL